MPVLQINLEPGESIIAESGELSWISESIQLHTTATGGASGGGLFGALKRAMAGASFWVTEYSAPSSAATASSSAS